MREYTMAPFPLTIFEDFPWHLSHSETRGKPVTAGVGQTRPGILATSTVPVIANVRKSRLPDRNVVRPVCLLRRIFGIHYMGQLSADFIAGSIAKHG